MLFEKVSILLFYALLWACNVYFFGHRNSKINICLTAICLRKCQKIKMASFLLTFKFFEEYTWLNCKHEIYKVCISFAAIDETNKTGIWKFIWWKCMNIIVGNEVVSKLFLVISLLCIKSAINCNKKVFQ